MNKYKFSPIIVLSNNLDFIIPIYSCFHCYLYLTKPLSKSDMNFLSEYLLYCSQCKLVVKENFLEIKNNDKINFQKISEIIFVESFNRKCNVITPKNIIELNYSLTKANEILSKFGLIQSHRSYIINPRYVKSITKTNDSWIIYFNETNLTALLSKSYRKNIFNSNIE